MLARSPYQILYFTNYNSILPSIEIDIRLIYLRERGDVTNFSHTCCSVRNELSRYTRALPAHESASGPKWTRRRRTGKDDDASAAANGGRIRPPLADNGCSIRSCFLFLMYDCTYNHNFTRTPNSPRDAY